VTDEPFTLGRRNATVVLVFSLLLYASAAFSGEPLSMHEARLPQVSRQMLAEGNWLLPMSGSRPWLERPPLPHWVLIAWGKIVGRLDAEWIVRLPSALAGALTCLLAAITAARLLGRTRGLLAGLLLATTYEFQLYAGRAEDEVYLAMLVLAAIALFVHVTPSLRPNDVAPPTRRAIALAGIGLFITLGLTHLVRGPLVGTVLVGSIVGTYLVMIAITQRRWRALFEPFGWLGWTTGLIVSLLLGGAWYVYAWRREPSLLGNLEYDFAGPFGHDPWWYYLPTVAWTASPWFVFALVGIVSLVRGRAVDRRHLERREESALAGAEIPRSARDDRRAERSRFLLVAALAPLLVLSIPSRKHHHYLVPVLFGWAMLASVGLPIAWQALLRLPNRPRQPLVVGAACAVVSISAIVVLATQGRLPGDWSYAAALLVIIVPVIATVSLGFSRRSGRLTLVGFLLGHLLISAWLQAAMATIPRRIAEREFIREANRIVPDDATLCITAKEALDFFLHQFYSRANARLLHNITFVRDRSIAGPTLYVITRARDAEYLRREIGEVEPLLTSAHTRRSRDPQDAWTLFRVTFRDGVERFDPPKIDVMQAMKRSRDWRAADVLDESPFLGPRP
jgi:4-amino-4-deoxy-L-arabinose transferase-like glycosyltransferase